MATINDQFFADLSSGATWSAGVAFKRSNPLPLDRYSVFASKAEAETYATSNAVAYPGQVIAIVENGEMVVYVLNEVADEIAEGEEQTYHLGLKQVGVVPTGDGKTIAVDENGKINLLVAADSDTEAGSQLTLQADGTLKWVKPNTATAEGQAKAIKALQDTVNGTDSVEGLVSKVGVAAEGENASTGLYALIDAEVERAEAAEKTLDEKIAKIDFVDTKELADALADYSTTDTVNGLLDKKVDKETYATDKKALEDADAALDTAVKAAQKAADDVTAAFNTFMNSEDVDNTVNTLKEIQAEIEKMTDATELATAIANKADKVEKATEGNFAGLDADGNLVDSGKKAADFATPGDVDTKLADYTTTANLETLLSGKQDTIAEGTYATPAQVATAKGEAIADADGKLALKANAEEVYKRTEVYTKSETDTKIDEKIASVTGGESAADVKLALESYRDALNAEIWGEDAKGWTTTSVDENGKTVVTYAPQYGETSRVDTLESKVDALEKVGAQANVIEAVVPKSGNTLLGTAEIVTADKIVTIDDSKIVASIQEAKDAASTANAAAGTAQAKADANAGLIDGLTGRMTTAEGKINDNAAAIAAHATEFSTLKGRVDGHDTTIASKANQSDVDTINTNLGTLQGTVGGHTTQIAGILETLDTKANSSDLNNYYTKNEIGTIAENKTIVQMIADATYNDSEVRTLIGNNATAIENIVKAETGAIAVAKAEALKAVDDLAKGAVKDNTDAIAILNSDATVAGSVAKTADDRIAAALAGADADFDTLKEMSDWLSQHKGSAAEMNSAITANTDAIKVINETTIPALANRVSANETAIANINNAETGILATAKAYTDAQIPAALAAYKVKDVDNTTLQLSETGVASVKAISTDLLIQGTEELILNGGSAV